jgi:hypothetical protein
LFGKIKRAGFICSRIWVVSSVGLEHYLDRVGVSGSNPLQPTKAGKHPAFVFLKTFFYPFYITDYETEIVQQVERNSFYINSEGYVFQFQMVGIFSPEGLEFSILNSHLKDCIVLI